MYNKEWHHFGVHMCLNFFDKNQVHMRYNLSYLFKYDVEGKVVLQIFQAYNHAKEAQTFKYIIDRELFAQNFFNPHHEVLEMLGGESVENIPDRIYEIYLNWAAMLCGAGKDTSITDFTNTLPHQKNQVINIA